MTWSGPVCLDAFSKRNGIAETAATMPIKWVIALAGSFNRKAASCVAGWGDMVLDWDNVFISRSPFAESYIMMWFLKLCYKV